MTRATIITDASFCHKTNTAGWAAWIRVDGIAEPIRRYGSFKEPVENSFQAEMLAAINGVWIAKQCGATEFFLQTDCMLVVNLALGEVKKRAYVAQWNAAKERAGLSRIALRAKHVRGHTQTDDARSFVNRWCDKNAKQEMRKARKALL